MKMSTRVAILAVVMTLSLMSVGCRERGPAEEAGQKIDEAIEETKEKAQEAKEETEEALK